jgi:hypothetical protein
VEQEKKLQDALALASRLEDAMGVAPGGSEREGALDRLVAEQKRVIAELRGKEERYEEGLEDHRRAIAMARDELAAARARIGRLEEALADREAEAGSLRRLADERERLLRRAEAGLAHRTARFLRRLLGRGAD